MKNMQSKRKTKQLKVPSDNSFDLEEKDDSLRMSSERHVKVQQFGTGKHLRSAEQRLLNCTANKELIRSVKDVTYPDIEALEEKLVKPLNE